MDNVSPGFEIKVVDWLDAPGVASPELAATWAAYQVWVNGRCVSQVETSDGTVRKSVFGSLYPLAEWIAGNWWSLKGDLRPSAVPSRYWTWANVPDQPWLRSHNLRGAGDGMAWPNLTVVPEGAVTTLVWSRDGGPLLGPIAFASQGSATVAAPEVEEALGRCVREVLDRLADQGIVKTRLSDEWKSVGLSLDNPEERIFCETAARLGLDPYALDDATVDEIIAVAEVIPDSLRSDFFDSVNAPAMLGGAAWLRRGLSLGVSAAGAAPESLLKLRSAVAGSQGRGARDAERPWVLGYELARGVRQSMNMAETEVFDIAPWVGLEQPVDDSHGLQGLSVIADDHCGLVLPTPDGVAVDHRTRRRAAGARFSSARALGVALSRPEDSVFLLSGTTDHRQQVARAFAAELLAPAAGIRQMMDVIGARSDAAFEAVASRFEVSPLVVVHQHDNQLASR